MKGIRFSVYLGFWLLALGLFVGCTRQPMRVVSAHEEVIVVDSTWDAVQDTAYLQELAPITEQLNKELNVVIGYAPRDMKAYLPESELLNWACDALYDMAKVYYDGEIDFAVVNVGGIRCAWDKGNITRRNVFELMPFDNQLVILTLTGDKVIELCECFAQNGGQGVSRQLRMIFNVHREVKKIRINGKKVDKDAVYYIATSDYLSTGANHLTPLSEFIERKTTGKLIRDLYMEYILQNKVVEAKRDWRMNISPPFCGYFDFDPTVDTIGAKRMERDMKAWNELQKEYEKYNK